MKANLLDCVEVLDAEGELEGYGLIRRQRPYRDVIDFDRPNEVESVPLGDPRLLTKTWCCRSCCWTQAEAL
jgi:hypothetical protein